MDVKDWRGRRLRAHRLAASIAAHLVAMAELAAMLHAATVDPAWRDLADELDRTAAALRRIA